MDKETESNIGQSILQDDKEMLVVYKMPNITTSDFVKQIKQQLGLEYLKGVYELDALASGIVVCAKSETSFQTLVKKYEQKEIEFTFWGVLVGELKQNRGGYAAFVSQDKKTSKVIRVPQLTTGAKHFDFDYSVAEQVKQIALVKVKTSQFIPETMRFAFAEMGAPIFGDSKYGGDTLAKNTYLSLILARVRFENGTNGEKLNYIVLPNKTKPWTYFDCDKLFTQY